MNLKNRVLPFTPSKSTETVTTAPSLSTTDAFTLKKLLQEAIDDFGVGLPITLAWVSRVEKIIDRWSPMDPEADDEW